MRKSNSLALRWAVLLAAATIALGANTAFAGDPAKGKEKSTPCAACHGADGNSPAADFPKLAGQRPDYLLAAMQHYKSGKRKNPFMAPLMAALSKEDMADLAAYFASQKGLADKY